MHVAFDQEPEWPKTFTTQTGRKEVKYTRRKNKWGPTVKDAWLQSFISSDRVAVRWDDDKHRWVAKEAATE